MRQERTRLFVIAMMFMVLARVFSGGPAQATDPDFTHVPDILNGQRQLLQTDDLFIAGLFRNGSVAAAGGILQTKESSIVATRPSFSSAVHGDPLQALHFGVTLKSARLFDVTFDDMVSSVAQGDNQMIFVPGVSGTPIHLPNPDSSSLFRALDSAVGDFTGDGYDDVFIVTSATHEPSMPSPQCRTSVGRP
jgi:hypothetical protein